MICFNNEIWRDFVTYRHLSSDLFLPGIVNHSRIRGAVHYVKIDTRKQCVLGVVVLWCGTRLLNTRGRCWAALLSCDFFPPQTLMWLALRTIWAGAKTSRQNRCWLADLAANAGVLTGKSVWRITVFVSMWKKYWEPSEVKILQGGCTPL